MESTYEPLTLHLFEDKNGHRIVRAMLENQAPCSYCGGKFILLQSATRQPAETAEEHWLRMLRWKRKRGPHA